MTKLIYRTHLKVMGKMWLARLLDFFFPHTCAACGDRLAPFEEHLCKKCLRELPATNFCKRPSDNYTYNLFKLQIPIKRASSFMRYMPASRFANIVKQIKYHGNQKLGLYMGRIMAEEAIKLQNTFFQEIDLIIPVPITKKRRRQRRYNQSELLAHGISEVSGIPVCTNAVERASFRKSQTQTNKVLRWENVNDAFYCTHPELLAGKHLLLIDDVITTGATLLSLSHCIEEKADGVCFSVFSLGITNELALM